MKDKNTSSSEVTTILRESKLAPYLFFETVLTHRVKI